jgi:hypothetical protein
MSESAHILTQCFLDVQNERLSIERLWNNIWHDLHQEFPNLFPYGHQETSVVDLAEKLFYDEQPNASAQLQCVECDFVDNTINYQLLSVIHDIPQASNTTRDQLQTTLFSDSRLRCHECNIPLKNVLTFHHVPHVLFFSVSGSEIAISKYINIDTINGTKRFNLKGIIYHGIFHFISCIIKQEGNVWSHDGQWGRRCTFEKHIKEFRTIDLSACNK